MWEMKLLHLKIENNVRKIRHHKSSEKFKDMRGIVTINRIKSAIFSFAKREKFSE